MGQFCCTKSVSYTITIDASKNCYSIQNSLKCLPAEMDCTIFRRVKLYFKYLLINLVQRSCTTELVTLSDSVLESLSLAQLKNSNLPFIKYGWKRIALYLSKLVDWKKSDSKFLHALNFGTLKLKRYHCLDKSFRKQIMVNAHYNQSEPPAVFQFYQSKK